MGRSTSCLTNPEMVSFRRNWLNCRNWHSFSTRAQSRLDPIHAIAKTVVNWVERSTRRRLLSNTFEFFYNPHRAPLLVEIYLPQSNTFGFNARLALRIRAEGKPQISFSLSHFDSLLFLHSDFCYFCLQIVCFTCFYLFLKFSLHTMFVCSHFKSQNLLKNEEKWRWIEK